MNKEQKNKILVKKNNTKSSNNKKKIPFIGVPNIINTPEMNQTLPFFKTKRKAIKFFQLTQFLGQTFSKDPKTKVACVLLSPQSLQILSTGYNGIPRGIKETAKRWSKSEKYNWVTHAVPNAIYNASRSGVSLENCIVVTSLLPGDDSARALIQIGAKMILTTIPEFNDPKWYNHFKNSLSILAEAGIMVYYAYYDTSYHIIKSTKYKI